MIYMTFVYVICMTSTYQQEKQPKWNKRLEQAVYLRRYSLSLWGFPNRLTCFPLRNSVYGPSSWISMGIWSFFAHRIWWNYAICFLRAGYTRPECFHLVVKILHLVFSILKSNVHTLRRPNHMGSPNVRALIKW